MTIEEIKRAVDAGSSVKWASDIYDVVKSKWGEYLIVCRPNGSTIGLHGREGTDRENHLNGDEDQFYVSPSTRHDPRYVDALLLEFGDDAEARERWAAATPEFIAEYLRSAHGMGWRKGSTFPEAVRDAFGEEA